MLTVRLEVEEGRGIQCDSLPFVEALLDIPGEKQRPQTSSAALDAAQNPQWDDARFTFDAESDEGELVIRVLQKDGSKGGSLVGQTSIPISKLREAAMERKPVRLDDRKGIIRISASVDGSGRPARDVARTDDASAQLEVGAQVEADYRGRGKWYAGRITRVRLDGTCDIDYDDGEQEDRVPKKLIRLARGAAAKAGRAAPSTPDLAVGDAVEANYKGKGRWFKGRITVRHRDGTFDVRYDDGDEEEAVEAQRVRALERSHQAKPGSGYTELRGATRGEEPGKEPILAVGDRIEANYKRKGRFFKGKIVASHSDGTFDVRYDDGDSEDRVRPEDVRLVGGGGSASTGKEEARAETRTKDAVDAKYSVGDAVEADYKGKGRFFAGRIARCRLDGTFDVNYDDGEKAERVPVRLLRPAAASKAARAAPPQLEAGDRVEANYRGKGRWFKGKITMKHRDGTCDVRYDDGDEEEGVQQVDIRPAGSSSAAGTDDRRADARDAAAVPGGAMAIGDAVEVNYKGRGKWFKGKIAAKHRDGTYDVHYDDGDSERNVEPRFVRSLEGAHKGSSSGGTAAANKRDEEQSAVRGALLSVGDLVEADFKGKGRWLRGVVTRCRLDGSFDVDYDSGDFEERVPQGLVRLHGGGIGGKSGRLDTGDRIEANYKGKGRWFQGKIVLKHTDGTFDVRYDDGDSEDRVDPQLIRPAGKASAAAVDDRREPGRQYGDALEVGDSVEVDYRGRGRWMPGKLTGRHSDGSYDVDYDDGSTEDRVPSRLVRRRPSLSGAKRAEDDKPLEVGNRVEADHKGRGRWRRGIVTRVRLDGSCDVEYDDGEKEERVPRRLVRLAGKEGGAAGAEAGRLSVGAGDRVEANYKGKGRWFWGKVTLKHRDGTFDIRYDDGDNEDGVGAHNVRPADSGGTSRGGRGNGDDDDASPSRRRTLTDASPVLLEGDKVEANYKGKGRWFKGSISAKNRDGTFDVRYDDGDEERNVEKQNIRTLDYLARGGKDDAAAGSGGGGSRTGSSLLLKGDRVEANYKGKGRYFKGSISAKNRDGTFDVRYDDGDDERNVEARYVRSLDAAGSRGKDGANGGGGPKESDSSAVAVGDRVEANYKGKGRYYKGKILSKNRDGTFDVRYDDGDEERNMELSAIRPLEAGARNRSSEAAGGSGGTINLAVGDRVEANYKARGRWLGGKIASKNHDGTFDVSYNDGDEERNVERDLIRLADAAGARRSGRDGDARSGSVGLEEDRVFEVGDAVEADHRDRDRWARGKVVRRRLDGTCDVKLEESGVTEERIPSRLLRQVKTKARGGGSALAGPPFAVRDRVEADYRGRGKWYAGMVQRCRIDGTYDIDYDDGAREERVAESAVRSQQESGSGGASSSAKYAVGDRIEGDYRARGRYFPGSIVRVRLDGTYDVDYDNGDSEERVEQACLRSASASRRDGGADDARAPERSKDAKLQVGTRVEADYKARGRFLSARVARCRLDGTYDLEYDDGKAEERVERRFIRSDLRGEPSASDPARRPGPAAAELQVGDAVEAEYRGRLMEGKVTRCRLDGSVDVDFGGGRREERLPASGVRLLGAKGVREDGYAVGDRVEVRYLGGSKWEPGKVARVHSDDTCDIVYDDGERESRVAQRMMRKETGTSRRIDGSQTTYREGDRVEARRDGRGRHLAGKVARVHSDGTYRIKFDDGEAQDHVEGLDVRRLQADERRSGSRSRNRNEKGSRSRGGSSGSSRRSRSSQSSRERKRRHKRSSSKDRAARADRLAARGSSGHEETQRFRRGDRVTACWRRASRFSWPKRVSEWFGATILADHGEGTYSLRYDDQEVEEDVPVDCLRAPEGGGHGTATEKSSINERSAPSRSRGKLSPDSWHWVEAMALELHRRGGGRGPVPKLPTSLRNDRSPGRSDARAGSIESEAVIERLLGRGETERLRGAFNSNKRRGEPSGSSRLDIAGVLGAYSALSHRADARDVKRFLHESEGSRGMKFIEDFTTFVKSYAWIFFGGLAHSERSRGSDSGDARALSTGGRRGRGRERGSGRSTSASSRSGSSSSNSSSGSGSEGGTLAKCARKLGKKTLLRLQDAFSARAERRGGRGGVGSITTRQLRRLFADLGTDVSPSLSSAWLRDNGMQPDDTLGLAGFLRAYCDLVGGDVSVQADNAAGGSHVLGGGRGAGDGLRPVAEAAAAIFQERRWRGHEAHGSLVRRLCVGRPPATQALLRAARAAFEAIDSDEDGEVEASKAAELLQRLGFEAANQGAGAAAPLRAQLDAFQGDGKDGGGGDFALPEFYAAFGSLLEARGAAEVSVAAGFAALRLRCSAADVRSAGEAVRRYVDQLLADPENPKGRRVNSKDGVFRTRVGRHAGGRTLMAAAGFAETVDVAESEGKGGDMVVWVLNGGFNSDGKAVKRLSEDCIALLRTCRDEIDAELSALDGTRSVAEALRVLRAAGASAAQARAAAELVLRYVTNALQNPKDPRVRRVRASNDVFVRILGRYSSSEAAVALMESAGFHAADSATIFLLEKPASAGQAGANQASAGKPPDGSGAAPLVELDAATTAFLLRRKADFEASIDALALEAAGAGDVRAMASRGAAWPPGTQQRPLMAHASTKANRPRPHSSERTTDSVRRTTISPSPPTLGGKPPTRPASVAAARSNTSRPPLGGSLTLRKTAGASTGGKDVAASRCAQMELIRAAFARLDAHGEGRLTTESLRTAFRAMGRDSSDARIAAWIRERDIDQDGAVSFAEFAASLHALVPTAAHDQAAGSNSGLVSRRPGSGTAAAPYATAPAGLSDAGDAAAAANEVAAAFGALRLCASMAECRRAVEAALGYAQQITASPGAKERWRVALSSKEFEGAVGRLLGGVPLMQALGFELEENGAVLAFRGGSSGRWDRVPDAAIERLNRRCRLLQVHARGLDHPEVGDVAAVSAAAAGLVACVGDGGKTDPSSACLVCVETALAYVTNALNHPNDARFRRIAPANSAFLRRVAAVRGGVELMVALGFREAADGALLLPQDVDSATLRARKIELESILPPLKRQVTAALAADAAMAANTTAASFKRRQEARNLSSKGGSTRRQQNGRAAPAEGAVLAMSAPEISLSRRGTGAGAAATAAAAAATKAAKQAAQALSREQREKERLQKEVQDLKDAAAAIIPARDVFTMAHMSQGELARASRVAAELGLELPGAGALSAGRKSSNRIDGMAATFAGASALQVAHAPPGNLAGPPRVARAPHTAPAGTKGRQATILAAAAAGTATLELSNADGGAEAGSSGKLRRDRSGGSCSASWLKAGAKVRVGWGATAEDSFVVDASSAAAAAEGADRVIVLETSLRFDHGAGEPVAPVKATPQENRAFRRRRTAAFVRDSVLGPVITNAVIQGEQLLAARRHQLAYERRAVPKFVYAARPVFRQQVSGPLPRADKADGGGVPQAGGWAAMSSLGRLLAVRGPSGNEIAAFDEGFTLGELRRFFVRVDADGSGSVAPAELAEAVAADPAVAALLGLDRGLDANGAADLFRALDTDSSGVVTWPEFLAFFRAGASAGSSKAALAAAAPDAPWRAAPWAVGLRDEEIHELACAFDMYDVSGDGKLSVEEVKQVTADLCGASLSDAALAEAMAGADADNDGFISFPEFVRLRVIQSRSSGGGAEAVGGLRFSLLAHLRRVFAETAKSPAAEGGSQQQNAASVSLSRLMERATTDPALSSLMGLRIGSAGETVREALSRAGTGGGGGGGGVVNWEHVEKALFRDPEALLFRRTPSVFGVKGTVVDAMEASSGKRRGELDGHHLQEARVYELTACEKTNRLYILLTNGELRVWDPVLLKPLMAQQLLTHDPEPHKPDFIETRLQHREWRRRVGLDPSGRDGAPSGGSAGTAAKEAHALASCLLQMHARPRILRLCPHTSLLLANTTAGDRCVRFHEPVALRRMSKVRLQLPPGPQGIENGIFTAAASSPEGLQGALRSAHAAERAKSSAGSGGGAAAGSVGDFAFIPDAELVLCVVAGRAETLLFCAATGLLLASLVGHTRPVGALLWLPDRETAVTGGDDREIRVWDAGMDVLPVARGAWRRHKRTAAAAASDGAAAAAGGDPVAALLETVLAGATEQPGADTFARDGSALHVSDADAEIEEALRALRLAVLRGDHASAATPRWRLGRVSAVLDRTRLWLPSERSSVAATRPAAAFKASAGTPSILVEVQYDDGDLELDVDPRALRWPLEASDPGGSHGAASAEGSAVTVRPEVGARVAVRGAAVARAVRRLFDRFDADGSGRVSTSEFSQALRAAREAALVQLGEDSSTAEDAALLIRALGDDRLQGLCRRFDADGDGTVDSHEFARRLSSQRSCRSAQMAASKGTAEPLPVVAAKLGMVVGAARLLRAHESPVMKLSYLPVSMLLASADKSGKVLLWDPCAANHRLTYPGERPHVRRWPGRHEHPEDLWTSSGAPYSCVLRIDTASPASADGEGGAGAMPVFMSAFTMEADPASARIVCPAEAAGRAAALDASLALSVSVGACASSCRGFLYLLDDGALIAVPVDAFHKRYVLLADAGFFEVEGVVGKPPAVAAAMRNVFRRRAQVLRVIFATSTAHGALNGLVEALRAAEAAVQPAAALECFSGASFVVFYSAGDGSDRDLTPQLRRTVSKGIRADSTVASPGSVTRIHANSMIEVLFDGAAKTATLSSDAVAVLLVGTGRPRGDSRRIAVGDRVRRTTAPRTELLRGGVAAQNAEAGRFAAVGTEVLCLETRSAAGVRVVSCWAVGRIALRAEGRRFDEPLPKQAVAAATDAFYACWAQHLHGMRGLFPARLAAARGRAKAEARMLARSRVALRLRALDGAGAVDGSSAAAGIGGVGDSVLRHAATLALTLPSRTMVAVPGPLYCLAEAFRNAAGYPACLALRPTDTVSAAALRAALEAAVSGRDGAMAAARLLTVPLGINGDERTLANHDKASITWAEAARAAEEKLVWRGKMSLEEAYLLLVQFGQLPAAAGASPEAFVTVASDMLSKNAVSKNGKLANGISADAASATLGVGDLVALAKRFDPFVRLRERFEEASSRISLLSAALQRGSSAPGSTGEDTSDPTFALHAVLQHGDDWAASLERTNAQLRLYRRRIAAHGLDLLLEAPRAALAQLGEPTQLTIQGGSATSNLSDGDSSLAALSKRRSSAATGGGEVKSVLLPGERRLLPAQCLRGIAAYEGRTLDARGKGGWTRQRTADAAGGPATTVAVLEITAKRAAELQGDGTPFGEQATAVLALLEAPALRDHPNLMHLYPDAVVMEESPTNVPAGATAVLDDDSDEFAGDSGEAEPKPSFVMGARRMLVAGERLEGWRQLREVLREQGALGGSRGIDVLRLWGRQLTSAVLQLHRHGVLVRDISAETVLVSLDGSRLKLVPLAHAAGLKSGGTVPGGALLQLKPKAFGAGEVITPPEALQLHAAVDALRKDGRSKNAQEAAATTAAAAAASPSWDVWTLGVLFYELAFGAPPPSVEVVKDDGITTLSSEFATAVIPYECISAIRDAFGVLRCGQNNPLQAALKAGSLAAIVRPSGALTDKQRAAETAVSAATRVSAAGTCRRRWVRQQMRHERADAAPLPSWENFCDKILRHLQLAPLPEMTNAPPSQRDKTTARLQALASVFRARDVRGGGVLDADTLSLVLKEEICLVLDGDELDLLAGCLAAGSEADGSSGEVLRYSLLTDALSEHVVTGNGGAAADDDPSRGLLDVIALCLSADPQARPTSGQLASHPFFAALEGEELLAANAAAAAYLESTGGNALRALKDEVESPLLQLSKALLDEGQDDTGADATGGPISSFNVGGFADVLRALHRLVRRPPEAEIEDDAAAQRHEVQRAGVVDAIFARGLLALATATALRFLSREDEASALGRGRGGAGFVEGDPQMPVGMRLLQALRRVLEELSWDLRRAGNASPVGPYADQVLRCATALYMGEEGALADGYGPIGPSLLLCESQPIFAEPRARCLALPEDTCRWSPAVSALMEDVVCDLVTEAGTGSCLHPAVRRYLERASAFAHRVRGAATDFDDMDEDDEEGFEEIIGFDVTTEEGAEDATSNSRGSKGGCRAPMLARARSCHWFIRSPAYFGELLGLGRALSLLTTSSMRAAAARARRQGVTAILTLLKLCGATLAKAEPSLDGATGSHGGEQDGATLQRAQLLVDFRVADKLTPSLADADPEVCAAAAACWVAGLRAGEAELPELRAGGGNQTTVDPRALLALSFCGSVAVARLVGLLRSARSGKGAAKGDVAAAAANAAAAFSSVAALRLMAAAGDAATAAWDEVGITSFLLEVINRASGGGAPASATSSGSGSSSVDANVACELLCALASTGSPTTRARLSARPGIARALAARGFTLPEPVTLSALRTRAADVAVNGSLSEAAAFVRETRAWLCSTVRLGGPLQSRQDGVGVAGAAAAGEERNSGAVEEVVGATWGLMRRSAAQLQRDGAMHPSTQGRAALALACVALARFVLTSSRRDVAQLVDVPPWHLGGTSSDDAGKSDDAVLLKEHGIDLTNAKLLFPCKASATATLDEQPRSALAVLVGMAAADPPFEAFRPHPLHLVAAAAATALADAAAEGGRASLDALEAAGAGAAVASAASAAQRLVLQSREVEAEASQLPALYPAGRAARVALLDRLLVSGHEGLTEQLLSSGLVLWLLSEALPDTLVTVVTASRLPANFARYNSLPLVRDEALEMLERIAARRLRCPALAAELARRALRADSAAAERDRLRQERRLAVRAGAVAFLRTLCRLRAAPVDRALAAVGIPAELVQAARRGHEMSSTRRVWREWMVRVAAAGDEEGTVDREAARVLPRTTRSGARTASKEPRSQPPTAPASPERKAPPVSAPPVAGKEKRPRGITENFTAATVPAAAPAAAASLERRVVTCELDCGIGSMRVQDLVIAVAADAATPATDVAVLSVGGEPPAMEVSLVAAAASRLWTRCLAGMLRLPHVTALEVQGLGRLLADGSDAPKEAEKPENSAPITTQVQEATIKKPELANDAAETRSKSPIHRRQRRSHSPPEQEKGEPSGSPKKFSNLSEPARSKALAAGVVQEAWTKPNGEDIALLMDRLGGAVVELSSAFERHCDVEAHGRAKVSSAGQKQGRLSVAGCKAALAEMGLPPVRVAAATADLKSGVNYPSFPDFAWRYARATGLSGTARGDGAGDHQLYAEGPGACWKPLSPQLAVQLRAVHARFSQGAKGGTDDAFGDAEADSMLPAERLADAFEELGVGDAVAKAERYLASRRGVIDGALGGRLPFAEFARAFLHTQGGRGSGKTPAKGKGSAPQAAAARETAYSAGRSLSPPRRRAEPSQADKRSATAGSAGQLQSNLKGAALARREFEELDVSGDGRLSLLDLRAALLARGCDDVSAGAVRAWMARYDTNNRGYVEFEAFERAVEARDVPWWPGGQKLTRVNGGSSGSRRSDALEEEEKDGPDAAAGKAKAWPGGLTEDQEAAVQRTFNSYDLNGDGLITYLDLKTVFLQQGRDTSDEELKKWIGKRDFSGTGAVDLRDFRRGFMQR